MSIKKVYNQIITSLLLDIFKEYNISQKNHFFKAIEDAGADDQYTTCFSLWKKNKNATKTVLLNVYKDINQTLEDVQAKAVTCEH